jgi:hypothetical protein
MAMLMGDTYPKPRNAARLSLKPLIHFLRRAASIASIIIGLGLILSGVIVITIQWPMLVLAFFVGLTTGILILGLCQAGARGMREK